MAPSTPILLHQGPSPTPSQPTTLATEIRLNTSNAPLHHHLWSEALRTLSLKEKEFISKHSHVGPKSLTAKLEEVLKSVEEKKKVCKEKQWGVTFGGRTLILYEVANKVCGLLNKFTQIGDVAVNVDPLHAGLPWALVRLFLQIGTAGYQQMAALLLGLQQVICLINRCKIYEVLFLYPSQHQQALENLQSALIELYAAILQFLTKVHLLYEQNTLKRTAFAFLSPDDVGDFQKKSEAYALQVEVAAGHCKWIEDHEGMIEGVRNSEKLQRLLLELKTDVLGPMDTKLTTLWIRSNEEEQRRILNWISEIPVQDHHNLSRDGRTPETGEWLFQNAIYRSWRFSDESRILWLHGIPGAGKTKLVSKVIDDLLRDKEGSATETEIVAYFYCNRNEEQRRDPENVLRSFIRQLSTSPETDAIHDSLIQLYKEQHKTQRQRYSSTKMPLRDRETLVQQLINTYSHTILVIDALDECYEKTRIQFIAVLDELVRKSSRLKILISSRKNEDIKYQLEKKLNVGISATDNQNDISKFVATAIKEDERTRRNAIPSELKGKIVQTLLDKSDGMFQWASLQINQLLMLKRPRDMEERLGKLPDDLEAAYDEIYTSIQAQKGSGSEIAFRAFQWVITAYRPLSPEELVFAVCQDPSKDSLEEVDFGIDFVLESCHNLLILDEVQNVCRLAHLSVQEYFERHCSQPQANTLAAKICFIVLNDPTYWKYEHSWVPIGSKVEVAVQKNYSESHDLEVPWISEELVSREDRASPPLRSSPLRRYASYHWISHVEQHEKEPVIDRRVTELLEKFLRDTINGSLAYQRWQSIDIRNRPVPFTICASGLYRVLSSEWWDIGIVNVHQKDANGDSLLTWAVRAGSRDIAKHLLDRGADPDSRSWISSPLMLAASSLDEKMIQLLLTYKANINAFGNEESALVNAVKQQRIGNVKLLLAAKADLNIPERRQPLAVAVEVRNAELVRLLLEAGADANTIMYDGRYGSALIGVVSWGHYGLLLLFLEKGANVNAKANGKYGSALAAAARGRELEHRLYTHSFRNRLPIGTSGEESLTRDGKILNLLLKHGAEVNKEVGGAYGCALVAAARGGNQETVNLLLKKGANINCRVGGSYGTPLIAAVRRAALSCEEEDLSTVKLLLSLGADVNAKVGRDYTAFSAAGDNDKVLQLLKSYGAVEDGEEKRLRKIISALEFQESSSEETDTLSDESS